MIDWDRVLSDAGRAALSLLNSQLPQLAHQVGKETAEMVVTGQFIEAKKDTMTKAEYDALKRMQLRAAEGNFATFQGIGEVTARLAAEAAWGVVATALRTAAGIAFV